MPFSTAVKQEALVRSGRRCCLCLRYKGVKVEVHHILPEHDSHDNTLMNAITLCFDCHAEVGHYNVQHPKGNRLTPSELTKHRDRLWELVENGRALPEGNLDLQYLELIRRAFDRPAFNTPFRQEGRMEDFDKALDDTVLALNTGVFRARDNQLIGDAGVGKSSIVNEFWKARLYELEIAIQDLRSSISSALADGKLKFCRPHCYCGDSVSVDELDQARISVVSKLNSILEDAGINPLPEMLRFRIGG